MSKDQEFNVVTRIQISYTARSDSKFILKLGFSRIIIRVQKGRIRPILSPNLGFIDLLLFLF